ncbi:MAG TPA: lysylphosphatidylglycerol synthase domain-containing protein [Xanthobacteraceae bacterium]|jgi:putative membrane protein|nr:lysylphosphatidylglycerol synthase domain-containing protein [Xanthobacteraceae bacterium]
MKYFAPFSVIVGLGLLTALTAYYGFDSVLHAALTSHWATVLVVLARAIALIAAGIGWWLVLSPLPRSALFFIVVRFVRDALNVLFPFAVVGGDIIGARLLSLAGIGTSPAIASVLIDIFIQVVCLAIFAVTGVVIIFDLGGAHQLSTMTFVLLAVALPALLGFFLALNFGAFEPAVRWLIAFGEKRNWSIFGHVVDLGARLQDIWGNHRGLSVSFVVHLAAVFFGASEVWIALHFMGFPVGVAQAIAIEALGQGSRAAAFVLPGGLGVQDGTLIAVCAIFGIPAEVALAMSLIKRVPDLVLGLPSLAVWQLLERHRFKGKKKTGEEG